MAAKRYHICFLSQESPFDQRSWSGIVYHLHKQLSKYYDVSWEHASGMTSFQKKLLWLWNGINSKLKRKFTAQNYFHSVFLSKTIEKKIRNKNYDFIVAAAGEPELFAYLKTSIPIIYICDATFQRKVNYYPWHTGLCKEAIKQGNKVEYNAIRNSAHIIYSSQWAADSAVKDYKAGKNKVSVIDFGANLSRLPAAETVLNKTVAKKCNLLFLGVHWQRKGGDIAYKTFIELKKKKFNCSLTIIGCNPDLDSDPDLCIIPFLDKNKESDFRQLYSILFDTTFLFIPTRADCTPIVFSEAAAFGVPVITADTGGIHSVIKDGENGFCLPLSAREKEYAALIESLWNDKEKMTYLIKASRAEFESRLNWNVWIQKVNAIIHKLKTDSPDQQRSIHPKMIQENVY